MLRYRKCDTPKGIAFHIATFIFYIKTVVVTAFCNSTTYIFKNDIELHKVLPFWFLQGPLRNRRFSFM